MSANNIGFVGRVLDNVHGFIEYTETEEMIMNTLLFKRLQSIKQLSIVNWVFPGSEHTDVYKRQGRGNPAYSESNYRI